MAMPILSIVMFHWHAYVIRCLLSSVFIYQAVRRYIIVDADHTDSGGWKNQPAADVVDWEVIL